MMPAVRVGDLIVVAGAPNAIVQGENTVIVGG